MDSAPATTAEVAPQGWTYDPDVLEWAYFWNELPNCEAKELETAYGIQLGPESAIMCRTRRTGEVLYMLRSRDGTMFYLWNQIEDIVARIDSPTELNAIIAAIKSAGIPSLQITVLKEIPGPTLSQ